MSKLLKIEEALEQRSQESGDGRFDKYKVIKNELLANEYIFTLHHFPGGNDHGPKHIQRVKEYLDKLVEGEHLEKLSDIEIFVLLCALLFHDVGMMHGRKGHHRKSQELLTAPNYDFSLEDFEREFIGQVMVTHSSKEKIEDVFAGYSRQESIGGDTLRPKYLAALLRLADELDEDFRRAKNRIFNNSKIPEGSRIYWLVNKKIQSVNIDKLNNRVVITVNYNNADIDKMYTYEGKKKVNIIAGIYYKMQKLNEEMQYCMKFMEDGLSFREVEVVFRNARAKKRKVVIFDNGSTPDGIPEELKDIFKIQDITQGIPKTLNPKALSPRKEEDIEVDKEEAFNWFDLSAENKARITAQQADFVHDALEVINLPQLFGHWKLKVSQPDQDAFLNLEFTLYDLEKKPSANNIIIFPVGKYPLNSPKIKIEDKANRVTWGEVQKQLLPLQAQHLWKDRYRILKKRRLFHIIEQIAALQNPQALLKYQLSQLHSFLENHSWKAVTNSTGQISIQREFSFNNIRHQLMVTPGKLYPRTIPEVLCTPLPDKQLWQEGGNLNWAKTQLAQTGPTIWKSMIKEESYFKKLVKMVEGILNQNYI